MRLAIGNHKTISSIFVCLMAFIGFCYCTANIWFLSIEMNWMNGSLNEPLDVNNHIYMFIAQRIAENIRLTTETVEERISETIWFTTFTFHIVCYVIYIVKVNNTHQNQLKRTLWELNICILFCFYTKLNVLACLVFEVLHTTLRLDNDNVLFLSFFFFFCFFGFSTFCFDQFGFLFGQCLSHHIFGYAVWEKWKCHKVSW